MNRISPLLETAEVAVSRFDHPSGCFHEDPAEERVDEYSINFVERGHFSLAIGRHTTRLERGALFLTSPGMVFRCRHEESCPSDVCISVRYAEGLIEESCWLLGTDSTGTVRFPGARTEYWRRRLERGLAGPSIAGEACALDLLGLLGRDATGRSRRLGPAPTAWYRPEIERARERMHAEFDRPVLVATLAREAGLSSYHFIRLFRTLVGLPPHRYLIRIRLEEGARLLADGAPVTGAAFRTGFENLSHFTRSFQRWFGVKPSAWARLTRSERIRRKVQALLRRGN
jgi:AraC-like DNA-binding protein